MRRIRAAINVETFMPYEHQSWSHPITGIVYEDENMIQLRRYFGRYQAPQTYLMATFEPHRDGTRIHGKFEVRPTNRILTLGAQIMLMVVIGVAGFQQLFVKNPAIPFGATGIFILTMLAAYIYTFFEQLKSPQITPEEEAQFMIAHLRKVLEAG